MEYIIAFGAGFFVGVIIGIWYVVNQFSMYTIMYDKGYRFNTQTMKWEKDGQSN